MRVLVTGATGFVASHLVPRLAAAGHEVVALGHDASRIPSGERVEPLVVDLAAPIERGVLPAADAIVHLAQANVPFPDGAQQLFAVNTASTLALLEHARTTGAQSFVFTSSASVYGFGDRRFAEGDEPRARDFYSLTKLTAERLVASYEQLVSTTVLRLVAPYGPGQRRRLIPSLIDRVRNGQPITLNDGGRPRMNPVFVGDVVEVIERVLEPDGTRVLNVAGDEPASIAELAQLIGSTLGTEPVYEEGSTAPGDLVADNERMRRLVGRPLVKLNDGLARTVAAG